MGPVHLCLWLALGADGHALEDEAWLPAPAELQVGASLGGDVVRTDELIGLKNEPLDLNRATLGELLRLPQMSRPAARQLMLGRPYASLADWRQRSQAPTSLVRLWGAYLKAPGPARPVIRQLHLRLGSAWSRQPATPAGAPRQAWGDGQLSAGPWQARLGFLNVQPGAQAASAAPPRPATAWSEGTGGLLYRGGAVEAGVGALALGFGQRLTFDAAGSAGLGRLSLAPSPPRRASRAARRGRAPLWGAAIQLGPPAARRPRGAGAEVGDAALPTAVAWAGTGVGLGRRGRLAGVHLAWSPHPRLELATTGVVGRAGDTEPSSAHLGFQLAAGVGPCEAAIEAVPGDLTHGALAATVELAAGPRQLLSLRGRWLGATYDNPMSGVRRPRRGPRGEPLAGRQEVNLRWRWAGEGGRLAASWRRKAETGAAIAGLSRAARQAAAAVSG